MKNIKSKINKNIFSLVITLFFLVPVFVDAAMNSGNYTLERDAINVFRAESTRQSNKVLCNTVGEIATGESGSGTMNLKSGSLYTNSCMDEEDDDNDAITNLNVPLHLNAFLVPCLYINSDECISFQKGSHLLDELESPDMRSKIRLTWKDESQGESGYIVERRTSTGAFVQIAKLVKNSEEYEDLNVDPGTTYIYRVYAYKGDRKSNYSNEVEETTFLQSDIQTIVEDVITDDKKIPSQKNKGFASNIENIPFGTSLFDAIVQFIKDNETKLQVAGLAAMLIAFLHVLLQLSRFSDIILLLKNIFEMIIIPLGFLSRRKSRQVGRVYNIVDNISVPLAVVTLYKNNKKVETKLTNKNGLYNFLVTQGVFALDAEKNGYKIVKTSAQSLIASEKDYRFDEIQIDNPDTIHYNIPMQNIENGKSYYKKIYLKQNIQKVVTLFFYGGFLTSLLVMVIIPSIINLVIISLYVFTILARTFAIGKTKWGMVLDEKYRPSQFTSIYIYDENNKSVARTVTDEFGRYFILLEKGKYFIDVKDISGGIVQLYITAHEQMTLTKKIIITQQNKDKKYESERAQILEENREIKKPEAVSPFLKK